VVIAGFFLEPVCRAVERRWYPTLPPPAGAGIAAQILDGVSIGLRVLVLSLLSLLLAIFLPGIGQAIGWAITAWAVGRGMYSAVALRRMSRLQAIARYRDQRWIVLAQGAALTLAGAVPPLNFLVPVLGPAAMVHVLMSTRHTSDAW
jgi:CysZ protein